MLTRPSDPANFINFCAGQVLTNGLQNRDGSCNGIRTWLSMLDPQMILANILSSDGQNPGFRQDDLDRHLEP
jgi:hypothetical protein